MRISIVSKKEMVMLNNVHKMNVSRHTKALNSQEISGQWDYRCLSQNRHVD